jgi:hypothetical protein
MRYPLLLTSLVLMLSATARAEAEPAAAHPPATWSMGAGLGYGVLYLTGPVYAGMTGTGGYVSSTAGSLVRQYGPSASLFLEHQLSRKWWAIGRVVLTYSTNSLENSPISGSTSTYFKDWQSTTAQGSLSFGLRSILASWSRVEVSSFVLLGGGAGSIKSNYTSATPMTQTSPASEVKGADSNTFWSAGLVGGLICDVSLLSNLGVRFSTTVLNANYYSSAGTSTLEPAPGDGTPGKAKASGFDAGISISPGLELRVLF